MEIIYRKLEELKKLENNPRTISDEQLDNLKETIRNNPDYFEARRLLLYIARYATSTDRSYSQPDRGKGT